MSNQILFVGGKRYLVVETEPGVATVEEIKEGTPIPPPETDWVRMSCSGMSQRTKVVGGGG